jgi:hypothetical protein
LNMQKSPRPVGGDGAKRFQAQLGGTANQNTTSSRFPNLEAVAPTKIQPNKAILRPQWAVS